MRQCRLGAGPTSKTSTQHWNGIANARVCLSCRRPPYLLPTCWPWRLSMRSRRPRKWSRCRLNLVSDLLRRLSCRGHFWHLPASDRVEVRPTRWSPNWRWIAVQSLLKSAPTPLTMAQPYEHFQSDFLTSRLHFPAVAIQATSNPLGWYIGNKLCAFSLNISCHFARGRRVSTEHNNLKGN